MKYLTFSVSVKMMTNCICCCRFFFVGQRIHGLLDNIKFVGNEMMSRMRCVFVAFYCQNLIMKLFSKGTRGHSGYIVGRHLAYR